MATDGDYWADAPPDFDQRLRRAQDICTGSGVDWAGSPFWQFLYGLTWALLGAPPFECSDRWGWSNLLKIGWSVGNPHEWRPPVRPALAGAQRDVCVDALREEFEKLRNSLIVIASADPLGILNAPALFPKLVRQWKARYEDNWNKDHEETGCWSFTDPDSQNLYINCYHPRHAVSAGFWGAALGYIVHLARAMPRFA